MVRMCACLIFAVLFVSDVFSDGLFTQKIGNGYHTTGTVNGQNVDVWESPFLNGTRSHGTIGGQSVNVHSQPFGDGFQTYGTWGNQHDSSFRQQPVDPSLPQKTFGVQHENAYRIPAAGNLDAPSGGGWCRGTDVDYNTSPTYFDTGSAALDSSSLLHYDYERPRSRPVIEGYKYIGEDNPSFGDMVESAVIQAACYYGAKTLVKAFSDGNEAFSDGNEANTPVGYDSSYRQFEKRSWGWVRWGSLFFYIIALALVVGFVLVRMGNKKLLNLLESTFDKEEYGRRCVTWRDLHTRRDPQGCLVSVEMPASLKKLIYGIYAICALPGVVALCKIDWCNFKIAWNSYSWMVLVGCLILMALPASLHHGKSFARGVVVFICAAVIVCFAVIGLVGTFAEDDGDVLLVVLIISVVAMSFFSYLIIILVSPSTDEWLRMKKELKLENSRRRMMAIKAMGHRIISSKACLFAEKWYMWIAFVLILICFVVIFRGLFSPLPSDVSDAEKRRMAYGRHERMKQIEEPAVQGSAVLTHDPGGVGLSRTSEALKRESKEQTDVEKREVAEDGR